MENRTKQIERKHVKSKYKPNFTYLSELSGGDTSFIIEIIEMFISDSPDILRQSQQYFKTENYNLLRVTVHKLKSSVQVLGSLELAKVIQQIEAEACSDDQSGLNPLLIELNGGIRKLTDHLHVELEALKKA